MSKLILYCLIGSPSSRAVIYVAEHLGLELNIENVNINSESEKNIALNPTRVPVLDDDGILIFGTSTIMIYLVEKYGKTDALYPNDLVCRAKVNSMLFFESQFLFGRLRAAVEPLFKTISNATFEYNLFDKVTDSLKRFERILLHNGTDFVAGDSFTICDFACVLTVSSIEVFVKLDNEKHPMIVQWRNRMFTKLPELERNEKQNALDIKELLEHVAEMRKIMNADTTKAE